MVTAFLLASVQHFIFTQIGIIKYQFNTYYIENTTFCR